MKGGKPYIDTNKLLYKDSKAKSGEIVFVSPKIILTECIGQKTVNNTPIYLVKGNIDQTRKFNMGQ